MDQLFADHFYNVLNMYALSSVLEEVTMICLFVNIRDTTR
jgi:hypothetical protein